LINGKEKVSICARGIYIQQPGGGAGRLFVSEETVKDRERVTYAQGWDRASYARTCCHRERWEDGMGRGASTA